MNDQLRKELDLFQILSISIKEMIQIESEMVIAFKKSRHSVAGRDEYLSFWLKSQAFFISATALIEIEEFKKPYEKVTDVNWRFGVRTLRNMYAHELDSESIPSLHRAVSFLPEESRSVSMAGFVLDKSFVIKILQESAKNKIETELNREKRKNDNEKHLDSYKVKLEEKYYDKLKVVVEWSSKPNIDKILVNNIATQYYLILSQLFEIRVNKYINHPPQLIDEQTALISLENKIQKIRDTKMLVDEYRKNNCEW